MIDVSRHYRNFAPSIRLFGLNLSRISSRSTAVCCTFPLMLRSSRLGIIAICCFSMPVLAENTVGQVRKAVERSTLNQAGTTPFHLKATISPSFERDKDSGRTADVEIWWASPRQ